MGGDVKGLIIGGRYGEVLARQKSDEPFEIGELLVAEDPKTKTKVLIQAYDLLFGSQVSQQNRELIGGMALEESTDFEFLDPHLRQYTLAMLKELLTVTPKSAGSKEQVSLAKRLPGFFSELRAVKAGDFSFLEKPKHPLFTGWLRSGSKRLDVDVFLPSADVLSHHILIPATTGRGKSNLLKVMLWSLVEEEAAGMLVIDPHDEYYRPESSLSMHPAKKLVHYYSPDPTPGASSLVFDIALLRPHHFDGAAAWSGAQKEALIGYYNRFKEEWIPKILDEETKLEMKEYHEMTLNVLRRRVRSLLNIEGDGETIKGKGVFRPGVGASTVTDIIDLLESGHTVVVDTSGFSGGTEILIGSILCSELLARYKRNKTKGIKKPVVGIVLEEAPRVLGKEVLEQGPNIFSTIAREGRKFGVGLVASTQLPSLIPRQILANMNTKIILGIEMRPERQAVIDSAAQDLSQDDRAIAGLDKGEAIITTNFSPFAIPVKVPLFEDYVKSQQKAIPKAQKSYQGLKA